MCSGMAKSLTLRCVLLLSSQPLRLVAVAEQLPSLQDTSPRTEALRKFNTQIACDNRVHVTVAPVGDGLALCRRLS